MRRSLHMTKYFRVRVRYQIVMYELLALSNNNLPLRNQVLSEPTPPRHFFLTVPAVALIYGASGTGTRWSHEHNEQ